VRIFFYPLAGLYWLATYFRNKFFDWGILPSKKHQKPIIAVGNLSVGGTGKSPFTIYLVDMLKDDFFIGVVSRGYGRSTKGYHFANYVSTYQDIGDEPTQIFERFRNKIVVGVDEKRTHGIAHLIHDFHPQMFILDDAFQHRYVCAGFYILLTDYSFPYYKDYVLPLGRLREGRYGAKRADAVVVTKCPDVLSAKEKNQIKADLKLKSGQSLFFSKIIYDKEVISHNFKLKIDQLSRYNILLITGIAKFDEILAFCKKKFNSVIHLNFNDHHNYSEQDVQKISLSFDNLSEDKLILTTEKDYTRLKHYQQLLPDLFYLPINIELDRPEEFKKLIFEYLGGSKSVGKNKVEFL
jgi:tetraacyldisaccharide 4'-kinase